MSRTITPAAAQLGKYGLAAATVWTVADSLTWITREDLPSWYDQLPQVDRQVVWLLRAALRPEHLYGAGLATVPGRSDVTVYGLDGVGGGIGTTRQRLYVVSVGSPIPRLLLVARENRTGD